MLSAWLERVRDFRNRKVSNPDFRRWAARSALTRPIARRQANALFDLTAGFVYSQILAACVRLDLFEVLANGPLDVSTIAARIGLPEEGTERLLKAATALDLVEARSGNAFALGPLGAALVGNAGVTAMIRHHAILYGDLSDPVALLEGKAKAELGSYWAYAGSAQTRSTEPGRHEEYTALMAASQAFVATEVLDAWPVARHKRLLDVGGGDGTFLIAAAKAAPKLELALFDLPPVAAIARENVLAAGIAARSKIFGGNVFEDALPQGADLVTLNRVLHDHNDSAAVAILKNVRNAIAADGTLLVAEPMSGTRGAKASGDAYFGFYLLAMGQGRPRTAEEIAQMLMQCGFTDIRPISTSTPLISRIVSARAR